MMVKRAAKEAVAIVVVAAILGLAVYALRPDKIRDTSGTPTAGQSAVADAEKGYSLISADEAYRLYQKQGTVFADARHPVDYDAGHIKGALNLTTAQSEAWLPDFLAATDPATPIVTYCDGENCHLAPELAELLFFNGFDHVFYLENGWTRWREGGYPVE